MFCRRIISHRRLRHPTSGAHSSRGSFGFHVSAKKSRGCNLAVAICDLKCVGGRRYLPYAFTEHGAAMAAGILNSPRDRVSVYIVRAFVHMREVLASNKALARRIDRLEAKLDAKFRIVSRRSASL
jgi:hypothetical protein